MPSKEHVWPVKVVEVSVCHTPSQGVVVVVDFANLEGEVASLSFKPPVVRDLSDRLGRAYREIQAMAN